MSDAYVEYFIKLWLRSVGEPQTFALAEESWERFRRNYKDRVEEFFLCETNDGRFVGINLAHVDMAHFLWQSPPIQWEKEGTHSFVHLRFVDREHEPFAADEAKELADIFFYLEFGNKSEILSFTDIDGEEAMFTPSRLVWIEASTEFVLEDFEKLNDEMTSST